jgi:hypothetical protein
MSSHIPRYAEIAPCRATSAGDTDTDGAFDDETGAVLDGRSAAGGVLELHPVATTAPTRALDQITADRRTPRETTDSTLCSSHLLPSALEHIYPVTPYQLQGVKALTRKSECTFLEKFTRMN